VKLALPILNFLGGDSQKKPMQACRRHPSLLKQMQRRRFSCNRLETKGKASACAAADAARRDGGLAKG
jgi:hypothetical protein